LPAPKASPEPVTALEARLRRRIEASGPIGVAHFMAEANAHYYATRDPLGAAGDFTTAPEISQMFGELIGLCLADLWHRAGRPDGAVYVELGPGRGTLAADALRAMRQAGLEPDVHFVETSPVLRAAQAARVPKAVWHDSLATVPREGALLAVANEFFDALPVHQWVATPGGWRERCVDYRDDGFVFTVGAPVSGGAIPAHLRAAPVGAIVEAAPAAAAIAGELAHRLSEQGGGALIFDYGHARTAAGDTLQAVRMHEYADPCRDVGEQDLTAHVDFEALAAAARKENVHVIGPVEQGAWLEALGIEMRAAALAAAAPNRADEIAAARARLTAPDQMGRLFKALAIAAPEWPDPAGFA
jgi:NADH dehydrogenase [ubiquinone] 1 alpha subcomplex assembly factor 7